MPIRSLTKRVVYGAMTIFPVARFVELATASRARILVYHGVTRRPPPVFNWQQMAEDTFIMQMEYIKKRFSVVPLELLLHELNNKGKLPRRCLALSFDDGYENNFSVAYPILKSLSLPATVFVSTAFVDNENTNLWFDRVYSAVALYPRESADLSPLGLGVVDTSNPDAKVIAVSVITERLKFCSPQERDRLIELALSRMEPVQLEEVLFPGMTWRDLTILAADPLMTIGGHGHSHSVLTAMSPDKALADIVHNKRLLEGNLKQQLGIFSYPNGNWNAEVSEMVRLAGYQFAVTTREAFATSGPYWVERMTVRNPSTTLDFQALVSGVTVMGKGVRRGAGEASFESMSTSRGIGMRQ